MAGRVTKLEGSLDGINGKIKTAQMAADKADSVARKALGDVNTLKSALGVYAEAGRLQEALGAKLDTAAFNGKFDEQLSLALAEDGKITAAIDAAIKAATDEIYAVIKEFKTTFNQELRSLVFIPELYVDGIEATEYTYMTYKPITENKNADGKGTDKVTANDGTPVSFEVKGRKAFTEGNPGTFDPERKIYYHLNPLGAVVETGDLAFVSKDVEVITKADEASKAQPQIIASSVDRKNGILAVTMKAAGNKVVGKNEASIFALEAEVKRQDSKEDTTITSDYANLYATTLTPVAIAFSNQAEKAEGTPCRRTGCNIVSPHAAQIDPYYFLRPVNVVPVNDKSFTDAAGDNEPEMRRINIFDILDFSDYRGIHFYNENDSDPYKQLNLFKYYEVASITIDTKAITTDMKVNGVPSDIESTKLTDKTDNIYIKYNGQHGNVVNAFTISSPFQPTWGVNQYEGLVGKFGVLEYYRTDAAVNEAFTLRVPVTIGYAWGEISTTVDITVNPTMGN